MLLHRFGCDTGVDPRGATGAGVLFVSGRLRGRFHGRLAPASDIADAALATVLTRGRC